MDSQHQSANESKYQISSLTELVQEPDIPGLQNLSLSDYSFHFIKDVKQNQNNEINVIMLEGEGKK